MKGKIVLLVVLTFVLLLGLVFVVMQQRGTVPEADPVPATGQTEVLNEAPAVDDTAVQNPEAEGQTVTEPEAPQLVFPEEEMTAPVKQEENTKETQMPQTAATEAPAKVPSETEAAKEPVTEATEQINSDMGSLDENELPPMPF